ncbi:hypothetical protein B0T09DRAFT_301845 [Sordaria sp. MPI-SDFR-AT-0083]|nr:hypothetical protein B0T09DRAFT_301845 [Sordaria sp. MPI-SDFR-AT-0083]
MVVLRTLAALAMTAVASMACPNQRFSRFSIPGPLAMQIGDKVVPQDNDVVLTTQAPKIGTFERLSGSSYTAITVQPYGILVDSIDSNLLWLQSGLKPSATPSNFETSQGLFRVYELLNGDNKTIFPWTPSNLQGPEHASVLTLLFDTSNISPRDELYLQNAALNPLRFNFVNTMEQTSLADKVGAAALFLGTADSTKKPSSAAKTTYATLRKALNLSKAAQAPLIYRRSSEEPDANVSPVVHLARDLARDRTVTTTTTASPADYYPIVPASSEETEATVSPVVHLARDLAQDHARDKVGNTTATATVNVTTTASVTVTTTATPVDYYPTSVLARSEEPHITVSPAVHLAGDKNAITTATTTEAVTTTAISVVTTTAPPGVLYPAIMISDSHSFDSHNRMTVFGFGLVAAMLFAL